MKEPCTYSDGDWIVHALYGVGQIKGIEVKCISGEEKSYYRVEAEDSTFWMPVDQMNSDILRSLSTRDEIQKAIDIMQKPAKELPANLKSRQSNIREAQNRNTPRAIARLIRDLRAFKREKGVLNNTESMALRTLTQRFACEWAVVVGVSSETAALNLEHLLDPRQSSNGGQVEPASEKKGTPVSSRSDRSATSKWEAWPKQQTNKINR